MNLRDRRTPSTGIVVQRRIGLTRRQAQTLSDCERFGWKLAFVRETGGLYVGIVHAGVFGPRDADRRETHLRFVARQARRPGVWLASLREIADWWRARECVAITVDGDRLLVRNDGAGPASGLRVVLDHDGGTRVLPVPTVPPGATVVLDTGAHPHAAAS